MAGERGEALTLSAEEPRRGKPNTVEVVVAGRRPISATLDPALHEDVFRNDAWIVIDGLDLRQLGHIFPGGLIFEKGQSGHREIQVCTEERWRGGELVRAVAKDPRPLVDRKPKFALMTS